MAEVRFNKQTGQAVLYDGRAWVPTEVRHNKSTGQYVAFDGNAWVSVGGQSDRPAAPAVAPSEAQMTARGNVADLVAQNKVPSWGTYQAAGLDAPTNMHNSMVQAVENVPSSAGQYVSDIAKAVTEPIETASAIGNVGQGILQKLTPGVQSKEKYADAVGDFYANRYGGWENIKKTLAKDPVGMLGDASAVLSLGAGAAGRVPALAKAAKTVGRTARLMEPSTMALKGVGAVGRKVVNPALSHVLGVTTGTSGSAVQEAAKAGRTGGRIGQAFRDNMRGISSVDDVVTEAKTALRSMKKSLSERYRSGMVGVKADPAVLKFDKIDDAVKTISDSGVYRGRSGKSAPQTIRGTEVDAVKEVTDIVDDWKRLDPTEWHTPEGLDQLKQKIWDAGSKYMTADQQGSRRVFDTAYNAVKNEIKNQAPSYSRVMREYERGVTAINEVQRTMNLGPKANIDTALRKLTSVLRNNVNTNYGRREELVRMLEAAGGDTLIPKIAGQTMSSVEPRGLSRLGALVGAGGLGTAAVSNPWLLTAIPALGLTSPRLVGEAAHAAGRAAPAIQSLGSYGPRVGAFQSGRLAEELEKRGYGPRRQ